MRSKPIQRCLLDLQTTYEFMGLCRSRPNHARKLNWVPIGIFVRPTNFVDVVKRCLLKDIYSIFCIWINRFALIIFWRKEVVNGEDRRSHEHHQTVRYLSTRTSSVTFIMLLVNRIITVPEGYAPAAKSKVNVHWVPDRRIYTTISSQVTLGLEFFWIREIDWIAHHCPEESVICQHT
jgi:hypothetical protein